MKNTTDKVTLYIATHNITGKKYFGKTTRYFTEEDLQSKYHGSGIYWKRHLKKHGDDVTMEIYGIYNINEVEEIALGFSEENNIVDDYNNWANQKEENGLDGNLTGCEPWNKGKQIGNKSTLISNETLRNDIINGENGLIRKSKKAMKTMGKEGLFKKSQKRIKTISENGGFSDINEKISKSLKSSKRKQSIQKYGLFNIILNNGNIYKENVIRKEIIKITKSLWGSSPEKPIGINPRSASKLINNNKEFLLGSYISQV